MLLFGVTLVSPVALDAQRCHNTPVKRSLEPSKSNTSTHQKRTKSITSEKVFLINLAANLNAKDPWWAQLFAMLRASDFTGTGIQGRRMLREMSEMLRGASELKNFDGLGRCPVCGDLFAKLRRDQKACGKPKRCANTLRVRNWREKGYPEKYKFSRIERAERKQDEPRRHKQNHARQGRAFGPFNKRTKKISGARTSEASVLRN